MARTQGDIGPLETRKAAKANAKTQTPEALPEGIELKNATEAAVWRALPAHGANDDGGPTAAEIGTQVGLSTSQAGKMLKRLAEAGHAVGTKDGRTLRYSRSAPATEATPTPATAEPATEPATEPTPAEVLDAAVAGLSPFSGQTEAQAYAALHAGGRTALEAFVGVDNASALLDKWTEAKLVRVKDVKGGKQVTSYAKYAKASVPTVSVSLSADDMARIFGVPAPMVRPAESDAEPVAEATVAEAPAETGSAVTDALAAMEGDVQTTPAVPVPLGGPLGAASERLTEEQAREITGQIKGKLADLVPLVLRAHEGRADLALGYANWAAYCEAELFGVRVPLVQRQQAVRMLSATMSTRAVAGALGVSEGTVRRDLEATGGAVTTGALAGLDGKTYDRAKAPKKVAARVVEGSATGDVPAPPPVVPTESGTCINCGWAIARRTDKPGVPWTHGDGDRRCKDSDGNFAEPVVTDVTPAEATEAEATRAEGDQVGDAIAALSGAGTSPEPVVAPMADLTTTAGRRSEIVELPAADAPATGAGTYSADAGILPGLDTEAVAAAIASFAWHDYEITIDTKGVLSPLPADGQDVAQYPEWITDLAEHIANSIGR